MSFECGQFRIALESELLGRPEPEKLAGLSWHVHLLSCAECRELLEKEEALEMLLASLPEPRLPERIRRRVLARLRREHSIESRLDGLLELDEETRAPADLAQIVLARLANERGATVAGVRDSDARLDALLELDRDVQIPVGLAGRILRSLASERPASERPSERPATERTGPQPLRPRATARSKRPWILAVAAGLITIFLLRFAKLCTESQPLAPEPHPAIVLDEPEPDPDLLATLDVLEDWDLLMQDDVDVLLSTLAPADEALLEFR